MIQLNSQSHPARRIAAGPIGLRAAVGALAATMLAPVLAPAFGAEPISFQKQILPIFQQQCTSCHSRGALGDLAVQLDLSSYSGIAARSAKGVVVIPYHADNSPLMRVIDSNWRSAEIAPRMPPFGPKLSPSDINLIRAWINEGAKDN